MTAHTMQLQELLTPLAKRNGLELVAVETAGGASQEIVRVFLDREGGIDLDAIVQANRWITDALEADGMPAGSYTLEVSSPGVERPLRGRADFERFAGDEAVIKTRPIEGRSSFAGVLRGTDAEDVIVECDGTEHHIPLEAIKKARLKVEIHIEEEGSGEDA